MRRESVSKVLVAAACLFSGAAWAQFGSYYQVDFRASNGQFVSAEWGGERELRANRNTRGNWERFVLIDLTGGELLAGDAVQLRAQNGKYVSADNGGMIANRSTPGPWETFIVLRATAPGGEVASTDLIQLVAWDGRWVSAFGGGGAEVLSAGILGGEWETFTMSQRGRTVNDPSPLDPAWVNGNAPVYSIVNFQTALGHFFVAEASAGNVKANRPTAGSWERFVVADLNGGSLVSGDTVRLRPHFGGNVYTSGQGVFTGAVHGYQDPWEVFRIFKASGGTGVINSGDQINLQASSSTWVVAEGGGGGAVNANRTTAGAWETFRMWRLSTHTTDPSPLTP